MGVRMGERERERELASFNREGSCHVVRAILPPFVSLPFSCGSATPPMPQTAPSFTFGLLGDTIEASSRSA